jgi:hypothetical protein
MYRATALGRLGGKKGWKARAAALTPEERAESAQKAAEARAEQLTRNAAMKSPVPPQRSVGLDMRRNVQRVKARNQETAADEG